MEELTVILDRIFLVKRGTLGCGVIVHMAFIQSNQPTCL